MSTPAISTEIHAGFVMERPVIRLSGSGRMRDEDAALYLGCSARQLRKMRAKNEGPNFARVAGRIWYSIADLDEYDKACAYETTR